MGNYTSIDPSLLFQPSCVETIKNISQQKNGNNDAATLKKASQDFESILINFAIKAMWETVPKSGLFGEENQGMDTYTEIMHTALAQDIAAKGGFGIAPTIYKQFMKDRGLTEESNQPSFLKEENGLVGLATDGKKSHLHINGTNDKKDTKGLLSDEIIKRSN